MPGLNTRRRRRARRSRVLPVLILLLSAFAAVLVVLLIRQDPLNAPQPQAVRYPDQLVFTDSAAAAAVPLVFGATSEPVVTRAPVVAAQAAKEDAPLETVAPVSVVGTPRDIEYIDLSDDAIEPEDEPIADEVPAGEAEQTPDETNRLMPAPQREDFLPILRRALRTKDDALMIAITIDDCDDADTLNDIVTLGRKYGAKLTLFPTGDAMMNEGMTAGFRTCVSSYGFEIENHTFGHKAEYRLSNSEMALQIWKGGLTPSYVMGADYTVHFFRPYNNRSVVDQRTHYLCKKLGYLGIASYTYSYKDVDSAEELLKTLDNGNIYQFDMKKESVAMLEAFMKGANKKGYKMVTLNTLFGIKANRIGKSLNLDKAELPSMSEFDVPLYDLYLGDRTNAVYRLQTRLRQLGYLTTTDAEGEPLKADGIYGADTSTAVSMFQGAVHLPATGNADMATQEALYADDAPPRAGYVYIN